MTAVPRVSIGFPVGERTSGHFTGPFGHDARSTFNLRKDTAARA